jgi:hypothetical protein
MNKPVENPQLDQFMEALTKIVRADPVASRAAIDDAKSTKPSLHKRFVYSPAEGRD